MLLDKSHPEYKKIISRKPEITKKKAAYIAQIEHKAQSLQKNNKWPEAIEKYDEALKNLPGNKQLIASRAILIKNHDNLINELKKKMLLKRAHALIEYETVYNELELLAPYDRNAQNDILRHKNEKRDVANHLISCSEFALDKKDYPLAEECLQLASQLINTDTVRELLIKTKNKRKSIENQKRAEDLLSTYKKAYSAGDLSKARFHINTLITLQPDHSEAIKHKSSLDQEIKTKVDKGIAEGRELYSQNKIKKALKIWNKLIIMDPDNEELQKLISRAKKVSKKIETLSPTQKN
ncbi:MAG: hypothetical protein OEZ38_03225 [Gammaproteobacteria bacterium]|nr:hypothetical protein [Gammaproteobacteria bacterium]